MKFIQRKGENGIYFVGDTATQTSTPMTVEEIRAIPEKVYGFSEKEIKVYRTTEAIFDTYRTRFLATMGYCPFLFEVRDGFVNGYIRPVKRSWGYEVDLSLLSKMPSFVEKVNGVWCRLYGMEFGTDKDTIERYHINADCSGYAVGIPARSVEYCISNKDIRIRDGVKILNLNCVEIAGRDMAAIMMNLHIPDSIECINRYCYCGILFDRTSRPFGKGIKAIGTSACRDAQWDGAVDLPNVEKIYEVAFKDSKFGALSFGDKLKIMSDTAFQGAIIAGDCKFYADSGDLADRLANSIYTSGGGMYIVGKVLGRRNFIKRLRDRNVYEELLSVLPEDG